MATGLERNLQARARDRMWAWTIFVTPFPDSIALTEEVRLFWSQA